MRTTISVQALANDPISGKAREEPMGFDDLPTPDKPLILGADAQSTRRFDVPCAVLGLQNPPVRVQLRFLHGRGTWTILALVAPGKADVARTWLAHEAGVAVEVGVGLAPRTLRCTLDRLPPSWEGWLAPDQVIQIDIGTHGIATVFARAVPDGLRSLAFRLGSPRPRQGWAPTTSVAELTPRQHEILRNAVAMGYFDVPHRIDLRGLGRSMGLSPSAACQLLRRAQGKVVQHFVNNELLVHGPRAEGDPTAATVPPLAPSSPATGTAPAPPSARMSIQEGATQGAAADASRTVSPFAPRSKAGLNPGRLP